MDEFGDISVEGILQDALRFRDEGNFLMRAKEYAGAVKSYRKSIEYLDVIVDHKADDEEAKQLRATVHANAAQALICMEKYEDALVACDNCLFIDRTHKKALYRRAKALHLLDKHADALDAMTELLKIYSESEEKQPKDVDALYADIQDKLAEECAETLKEKMQGVDENFVEEAIDDSKDSVDSDPQSHSPTSSTAMPLDSGESLGSDQKKKGTRSRKPGPNKMFERSLAKKLVTGGLYGDKPPVDKEALEKEKRKAKAVADDEEPKELWESVYDAASGFVDKLLCCRRRKKQTEKEL